MDASGPRSAILSLARLDRIYCNIPSSILLDFKPLGLVLRASQGEWPLSDHAPVLLRLNVSPPSGFRVPSWVPRHPKY
eukprot:2137215-Pyramimonas_sp.AAC.1